MFKLLVRLSRGVKPGTPALGADPFATRLSRWPKSKHGTRRDHITTHSTWPLTVGEANRQPAYRQTDKQTLADIEWLDRQASLSSVHVDTGVNTETWCIYRYIHY